MNRTHGWARMLGLCGATVVAMATARAEDKPHVKDIKPLDAKAIETQIYAQHDGSMQLDPKIYDNRGFDVTVDCRKETGLTLMVKWRALKVSGGKPEEVWLPMRDALELTPDAKGIASARTPVEHFAKDVKAALAADADVYTYVGWVMYVVQPNGIYVTSKTSGPAVDRVLKEEKAATEDEKKKK